MKVTGCAVVVFVYLWQAVPVYADASVAIRAALEEHGRVQKALNRTVDWKKAFAGVNQFPGQSCQRGASNCSAELKGGPAKGPTLWFRDVGKIPAFKQTDHQNTDLYVDASWALGQTTTINGKLVQLKTQTCLATVIAMLEHSRGNTDYRIGQPGTWKEPEGAVIPTEYKQERVSSPDLDVFKNELAQGNPVVIQGYSPRLGEFHYMLAIGVTSSGNIVAQDPLSGGRVEIDGATMTASIPGTNLSYEVRSARLIDY